MLDEPLSLSDPGCNLPNQANINQISLFEKKKKRHKEDTDIIPFAVVSNTIEMKFYIPIIINHTIFIKNYKKPLIPMLPNSNFFAVNSKIQEKKNYKNHQFINYI